MKKSRINLRVEDSRDGWVSRSGGWVFPLAFVVLAVWGLVWLVQEASQWFVGPGAFIQQ